MVNKGEAKTVLRMTVREIRRTFRRFFAIFAMAAIGAGLFAGMTLAKRDFVDTIDTFYQESQVYDYRLTSSLEWDETSIENIRQTDGVEAVEGVWQDDIYIDNPATGKPRVYRVHSLTHVVNKVVLEDGRLPEAEGECLVDAANHSGIKIGDTLRMSEKNEAEDLEAFRVHELTVTGFANSPLYTSSERGRTAIGNGKVTGFIVVGREAFADEYAAEIDVKLTDRSRFMTDAYAEMMDNNRDKWEETTQATAEDQALRMRNAAEAELKAAKDELAKVQAEVNKKLAPSKRKLEKLKSSADNYASSMDALDKQIKETEEGLDDLEKAVKEAEQKYKKTKDEEKKKKRKQELDEAAKAYKKAKDDIKEGKAKVESFSAAADAAFDKYNKQLVKYNEEEAEVSKVLVEPQNKVNAAQDKLDSIKDPSTTVLERRADASYTTFENDFRLLGQISGLIPIWFLFAGAIGCAGLCVRWIKSHRRDLGLMMSMGMNKRQIAANQALCTTFASLAGVIVGHVLGVIFVPRIIWHVYKAGGFNLDVDTRLGLRYLLLSLIVIFIFAVGASLGTSGRVLSQQAAQLRHAEKPAKVRHLLIEVIPEIWRKLPAAIAAGVRRALTDKKRLLASILGLGVCVMLLITGLGIRDSVAGFERRQYDNIQVADADVTYTGGKEGEAPTNIMSGVTKIGGKAIAYVGDERDVLIGDESCRVHIMAPYDRGNINHFFVLRDDSDHGLSLPKEGEALISYGLAERLKVKKGDTIELPKDVKLKVVGIFINYVYDYVVVPPVALQQSGASSDVNSLFVNFAKEANNDKAQTALSSLANVTSVTMDKQNKKRVAPALAQVRTIAWITGIGAAILAFWMMSEMASAQMFERRKEWRAYRALGYQTHEMMSPLVAERLVLTAVGTIAGMIGGSILHRHVMERIDSDVLYIPPRLGLFSYLLVLAVMLIAALIIHLFSRSRLPKRPGPKSKGKQRKSKRARRKMKIVSGETWQAMKDSLQRRREEEDAWRKELASIQAEPAEDDSSEEEMKTEAVVRPVEDNSAETETRREEAERKKAEEEARRKEEKARRKEEKLRRQEEKYQARAAKKKAKKAAKEAAEKKEMPVGDLPSSEFMQKLGYDVPDGAQTRSGDEFKTMTVGYHRPEHEED